MRLGAGGLPRRIGERFSQAVCRGPWACLEQALCNPFQLLFFTDFFACDPLILGGLFEMMFSGPKGLGKGQSGPNSFDFWFPWYRLCTE